MPEVRFGVLGPVAAWRGARAIEVRPGKCLKVLGVLLLHANQQVDREKIIQGTWAGNPPRSAVNLVQKYVGDVRRSLELDDGSLQTVGTGYVLRVAPGRLDSVQFASGLARARAYKSDGDLRAAGQHLAEAMALWRGPAFSGIDTAEAAIERARLDEYRCGALEDLAELDLLRGEHASAIPELSGLAAEHPYRERVRELLMVALYRSGRQGDALAVFDEIRRLLAEELGASPGHGLQRVHAQILHGDPAVDWVSEVPAAHRNCLPRDLPYFAGRHDELARLAMSAEDRAALYTVDGMAGVGKTAFAVRAAHLLADRFPDGALFVDLQGHSAGKMPLTVEEILHILLGQLGTAPGGDAMAQWRATTAALRLLVVFDNAVDHTQVAPLLPTGQSLVIVTSRARLPDLAGARPLSLTVLAEEEAEAFLAHLVGEDRAGAEPEAVAQIVRLCAGLPLALRLSGARLAHRTTWPIAHLSAQLADARQQLPRLFADREVALAFRMSHEQLSPVDQQLFSALGRHPGADADTAVLAAMTGLPANRADEALQRLVDVHLAEEPAPGRYRQHDLLRQYARGMSDDPRMTERMLKHYLTAITEAAARIEDNGPGAEAARAWLTAERANVLAATRCAAAEGQGGYAWQLAISLWHVLCRNFAGDAIALLEQGLTAARATAEGGEDLLRTLLALAHWSAGHTARAHDLLTTSAEHRENTESHAHTLALLALMHLQRGAHAQAAEHAQTAFDELAELPALSPLGIDATIITHWTRGVVRWLDGSHEAALAHLRTACSLCDDLGQLSPNDHVHTALARCLIELSAADEALVHLRQARELRQRIGDRAGEAEALTLIGTAHRALGHPAEALKSHRVAVTLLDDDTRLEAHARIELGRTLAALGNPAEAARQHELALAIAVRGDHLQEQAQAHDELARTHGGDDSREADPQAGSTCLKTLLTSVLQGGDPRSSSDHASFPESRHSHGRPNR
ncbi:AfsR/SARP family transcriptional regulator [Amycolatopsis eburnea]|uniref:Tetratricopeptide repeat protein n=1 Tax=Amycolatopsis eburnea TaxID=2267691 RepID=A0A427SZ04_9PSEU|nr:BTAD domain-containing putative transcriptional regulator [Amycolatopsis eburnea]RSD10305.1 tetratricopeptide repeat protein [Amycolatopsis eburnea]